AGIRFGDLTIPAALGGKRILPYSDFLLHDIGTGDGIVQTQFADYPPTGLVVVTTDIQPASPPVSSLDRKVNIAVDIPRLNALLRGEPDPKYPARSAGVLRTGRDTRQLTPAIQLADPRQVVSSRVRQ